MIWVRYRGSVDRLDTGVLGELVLEQPSVLSHLLILGVSNWWMVESLTPNTPTKKSSCLFDFEFRFPIRVSYSAFAGESAVTTS